MSEAGRKLDSIRAQLRGGNITLQSNCPFPDDVRTVMERALQNERAFLALIFGEVHASQRPSKDFLGGLERVFSRMVKASVRAVNGGHIPPEEAISAEEDFKRIASEYRAMIGLLSEFGAVNGAIFNHSSSITPYHDPQKLELELRSFSHMPPSTIFHALTTSYVDPIARLERFSTVLERELSNRKLSKLLLENGMRLKPADLSALFKPWVKERLAFHHPDDLEGATVAFVRNMQSLTKESIQKALRRRFSEGEFERKFPQSVLIYIALKSMNDPLGACLKYYNRKIKIYGQYCPD